MNANIMKTQSKFRKEQFYVVATFCDFQNSFIFFSYYNLDLYVVL